MALKLVIGPANAEKARVALDDYRRALDAVPARPEPILVVPTFADVEVYRRELASTGAVFGVQVMRFGWLLREIAQRTKVPGTPLGALARERVAAVAAKGSALESARTPGFAPALVKLFAEFGELRLDPPRVIQALRAWTEDDPGRRAYAGELGSMFAAYRRELERVEAVDEQGRDAAALDALRLDPEAWGGSPVVVYGFDDLTPLQRDAIETLAVHAAADVTLTLTYERGRSALAARAGVFEDLRALPGAEIVELHAVAEHYAEPALHHLERTLFEPGEGTALFDASTVAAGDAVQVLEGGGERAEVELVADEVAALIAGGVPPEEIAVVWRSPEEVAGLVGEVLAARGIPIALTRRLRVRDTALGRGLLALLRCALLEGSADDLLTWLRTPGLVRQSGMVDALERNARRSGARTAATARGLWDEERFALDAIDRLADAAARGPAALCDRLAREAAVLLARPHRRQAPILDGAERTDASAAAALRSALRELGRLARRDPALVPAAAELERVLGDLAVFAGDQPGPGRVQVTRPAAIRARRVRALFLCGLNEGVFPKAPRSDPLLADEDRLAVNRASGLRLALDQDHLARERFLLYTAVSRPTERLYLSWRAADDEGGPAVRSLFVDDVVDRFSDAPLTRLRRRALGAVDGPWEEASGAPLGPLTVRVVEDDQPVSASAIEAWASCPVKWFVERHLRPDELVPDPEPLVRGTVAHAVLRDVFAGGAVDETTLTEARERLHAALVTHTAENTISVSPERLRMHVQRLESDLVRYLEHVARAPGNFAPSRFEEPVRAQLGTLTIHGVVDRVDLRGGEAVIVDYKGKTATPVKRWIADGKLQVGLYALALRQMGVAEPAAALYQPLGTDDPRPRGAIAADADLGREVVKPDVLSREEFEQTLRDVLAAAEEVVAEMRAGALEPRPDSCGWAGSGCSYPTICRCD